MASVRTGTRAGGDRGQQANTGDLFWTGRYPVVDYGVGGSLAAMAATLEQMDKVGDARRPLVGRYDLSPA